MDRERRNELAQTPDWIRVILGDNLVFDRKNNKDNEVMIGQSATPEQLKKIEADKVAEENAAKEKAEKEKLAADAASANSATNPTVEATK